MSGLQVSVNVFSICYITNCHGLATSIQQKCISSQCLRFKTQLLDLVASGGSEGESVSCLSQILVVLRNWFVQLSHQSVSVCFYLPMAFSCGSFLCLSASNFPPFSYVETSQLYLSPKGSCLKFKMVTFKDQGDQKLDMSFRCHSSTHYLC